MIDLARRIEFIANVAIIVVATLLAIVLTQQYLLRTTIKNDHGLLADQQSHIGTRLSLPDIDWNKNRQTLVLAISSNCHFCTESAAFYRQLSTNKRKTQVIAVLPQPVEEGRSYLERIGVSVDEIRQLPLDQIGVHGTPTLLLVDASGVVTKFWVGKLPPTQEAAVLDLL